MDLTREIYEKVLKEFADSGCHTSNEFLDQKFNKLPDNYTGWVRDEDEDEERWLVYAEKGHIKYGFNADGVWFVPNNRYYVAHIGDESEKPATNEEVFERLKEYAESISLKVGSEVKSLYTGSPSGVIRDYEHWLKNTNTKDGEFWATDKNGQGIQPLSNKGEWAKPITKKVLSMDTSLDTVWYDEINVNGETYIKKSKIEGNDK